MSDVEVGFYGKLPTHGDFLRRRASDGFVAAWDAWLQAGMAESRAALGDRWLDVYLTSPAWRFVCAPGACGAAPVAGVLVPSIDRVGRYFPLTVVTQLPPDVPLMTVATRALPFFTATEQLLVDTLAAEDVDFEQFDARVAGLRDALAPLWAHAEVVLEPEATALLRGGSNWQVPIESSGQVAPVFEQILSRHMMAVYDPLVFWWTEGSSMVEASCLIGAGLPPASAFGALLNGDWAQHRWRAAPAQVTRPTAPEAELLVGTGPALRVRSVAATDPGRVRSMNQDAFVERPDIGVWVVADGLGGHRDGEIASREVCDALADLPPTVEVEPMVQAALERIRDVNAHLYRTSTRSGSSLTDRCASTVVALIARGSRCAVLWAGDSRVYRWRAGHLERLTTDHSVGEANPETGRHEAHAITRAVGVAPSIAVDVFRDELRAGDRFLLCSDGLTRIASDEDVCEYMAEGDLRAVARGLIDAALEGGGPDNITVVVAEAIEADAP